MKTFIDMTLRSLTCSIKQNFLNTQRGVLQINKVLYKDNKFELAIDNIGLYVCINESRYELSSHYYEPCTYIKSQDGAVDIVMRGAFDFGMLISGSGEWNFPNYNPLSLCEALEAAILKDKAQKKQQIVNETGYKTAFETPHDKAGDSK